MAKFFDSLGQNFSKVVHIDLRHPMALWHFLIWMPHLPSFTHLLDMMDDNGGMFDEPLFSGAENYCGEISEDAHQNATLVSGLPEIAMGGPNFLSWLK